MLISLPPQLEKIVQEKVQSGEYASESEVMQAALELLDERDAFQAARLEALREEVRKGDESGEPMPADEVMARIRQRVDRIADGGANA